MSPRRHARAGFTLVELMVSITITGIVTVALFSVARSATATFNEQQRTAEMQLRLRFAMEQVRADLARAGYMATPNSNRDPKVCPRPNPPLQGIEITRNLTFAVPNVADNAFINPIVMRLVGNYSSMDEYAITGVAGNSIQLQSDTPQWQRVGTEAEFRRIFAPRRLLRITSTNGQMQFTWITAATWNPALPQITVNPAPTLVGNGVGAAGSCGLPGMGVGSMIAPVSMVEYTLITPGQALESQATAYEGSAASTTNKTDLVRREYEIASPPALLAGSERLVGEYAVDFDAALVVDEGNPVGNPGGQPRLRTLPFGPPYPNPEIVTTAGPVAGGTSAFPERIRSVRVRLSIREREQNPDFGFEPRASAAVPLTRFRVFPAPRPGSARVRTLTAEVALPNLAVRNLRSP